MPRRNRIDPFGDLHADAARGLFTGNRGCLVDDHGGVVRHHRGALWITCVTAWRGRRIGLARPGRWTPVFFLDEAVALAAGHRPCGYCRRDAYLGYRAAVGTATGTRPGATELNRRLAAERFATRSRPRSLDRAADRRLWTARSDRLPDGTVVLHQGPRLVRGDRLLAFSFDGWGDPMPRPDGDLVVLTPPTSVAAMAHGFVPVLHSTARIGTIG
jgi:hypothetical protein